MPRQLSFTIDEPDGIVRVTGVGMWAPEQAAAHFRDLERVLLKLRGQRGALRVIVDLREAAVQTAQTTHIMHQWTSRIYRDDDRVAVLCAAALLALQIKRAANVRQLATFHEMAPALAWVRQEANERLSA